MCFDQPSSLVAFSIGLASAYAAFVYGYTVLSVLLFIVALMQLSEFLIWRGIDNHDVSQNRAGTALARTTLGLHALAVCIAVFVFALPTQQWRRYGLVVCTILSIVMYGLIVDTPNGLTTYAGCASGCRLKWTFPKHIYGYESIFMIVFVALLLSKIHALQTLCIFLFYILTLAGAIVTSKPGRLWEAMSTSWCYASSFGSPLLIATMVGLNIPT